MSLIIKDEETCRLASELAELTGETTVDAIASAIRERLERKREIDARVRAIMEIGKHSAELMRDGPSPAEIIDSMYDEHGAPR